MIYACYEKKMSLKKNYFYLAYAIRTNLYLCMGYIWDTLSMYIYKHIYKQDAKINIILLVSVLCIFSSMFPGTFEHWSKDLNFAS